MERFCRAVDNSQKKLKILRAVSSSIFLGKSENRDKEMPSFRSFKQETLARRELNLEWSETMRGRSSRLGCH